MAARLTPVPFSIGCADRYLANAGKSMESHFLAEEEKHYQSRLPAQTLVVQAAHPVFCYMKEVPENVIKICSNVFDMMPKTGTFIFSPNIYEPGSVKSEM